MNDSKPNYDFDQLYPGAYLAAGEFAAGPRTLTIDSVELHELEDEKKGKKMRGIVFFKGETRGLVLNKTNGYCLRHLFGRTTGDWIGKRITLFMDTNVAFGAKKVSAIRIYGSPEIQKDTEVEIKHPKKKAYNMKLRATGEKPAAAPSAPTSRSRSLTDEQRQNIIDLRKRLAAALHEKDDQMSQADAAAEADRLSPKVTAANYDDSVRQLCDLIDQQNAPLDEAM